MNSTLLVMAGLALVLFLYVFMMKREALPPVFQFLKKQAPMLYLRLPLALLTAAFLSKLLPSNAIAPFIGPESGWTGILLACIFGAVLPGGPIVTFPLALVVWRAGAGQAQMVAFLSSWSIFAMHRIITYELPLVGPRFVALRLSASSLLPIIAGALAMIILFFV